MQRTICAISLLGWIGAAHAGAFPTDHHEFDATLDAPFIASADGSRSFDMQFQFPGAEGVIASWRLVLLDAGGRFVREWTGHALAGDRATHTQIRWDGTDSLGHPLTPGTYTARLESIAGDVQQLTDAVAAASVDSILAAPIELPIIQEWEVAVGPLAKPQMPTFAGYPTGNAARVGTPAIVGPYTVYLGNLHSQTNHSDGGGDLSTCDGAENPQAGLYGPDEAFEYARLHGLDFLMASEHNHMYDGSNGTNASATPAAANGLYASGRLIADEFNANWSGQFLALYGMEWGVITNGGHMNIIGEPGLYSWEYNGSSQLLGAFFTAKNDYAALYPFMKSRGVVGQFNHPDTSGQFLIGADSFGYSVDGDEVMVLAEILNSSAFSVNTTETETSRSTYEGAWKKMLERGFHTAPSTNQDNHCANWGASYTNRTAVLVPTNAGITSESFGEAIRARRVFATGDKTAQIILNTRDKMMGSRINNIGTLPLIVNYASTSGRTVTTVQVWEGVPGRNGTMTVAATTSTPSLTPSIGAHVYYAKITQDDGKLMWSAPIWVQQLDATDAIFLDGFGSF